MHTHKSLLPSVRPGSIADPLMPIESKQHKLTIADQHSTMSKHENRKSSPLRCPSVSSFISGPAQNHGGRVLRSRGRGYCYDDSGGSAHQRFVCPLQPLSNPQGCQGFNLGLQALPMQRSFRSAPVVGPCFGFHCRGHDGRESSARLKRRPKTCANR